jgi:hypothetical protein
MPVNRGMAFGRGMAEGLEHGEATGDPVLDLVMERIPRFEIMDKPLEAELKTGRGQRPIPLLAKPDTMRADMSAFKEYKTGQEPWSKHKVDGFGQITFYAIAMFCRTGKIPHDIELVHVETTKGEYGRIEATGTIHRYMTVRNMSQILNFMVRMKRVWEGIAKVTEEELL